MLKLALSSALAAMLALAATSTARAQDPDEVAILRKQVELLEKENELLKKEIELLKTEAAARLDGAKGVEVKVASLSDLLPEGTVLQGTFRATQGGGHGEITITISERDGNRFRASSILKLMRDQQDLGTSDGTIEGMINGARLTWTSVGSANRINATLVLRGDGLEGTYKTQAGIFGTIGLRKVR